MSILATLKNIFLKFLTGITWGMLAGVIIITGLVVFTAAQVSEIYQWIVVNLGISSILFVLILLIYVYIWHRINCSLLQINAKNWKQIIHDEQLLDMLTGLAFGVGVIWTAIGMREALMAAFGHNEIAGLAAQGALGMLDQLINGGILTALTSTVVGGILGYVLRIVKTLTLMSRLNDYEELLSQAEHEGPQHVAT